MSEWITAENMDLVIKKNCEIKDEVLAKAIKLQTNPAIMKVAATPQFALSILQGFGLVQMPIEDKFWSGAIFVKNGKIIPVLNTALPRANQYFAACMLLNGVDHYFTKLPEMDFISKIFRCMATFQAPYKAVLVSLYEYAVQSENEKLGGRIKEVFHMIFLKEFAKNYARKFIQCVFLIRGKTKIYG